MSVKLPDYIDLNKPEQYDLTVLLHPRGYSFSLYSAEKNQFYYHPSEVDTQTDALTRFKDLFFENEFLVLPFRKIQVVNHTPGFTFVPSLLFEEKDKESYFGYNFAKTPNRILCQELSDLKITLLHEIDDEAYEFFQRSFVMPRFVHYFSPLIAYSHERGRLDGAHSLFVNANKEGIDITLFFHDDFILGNHFECKQSSDAIYFILLIWKEMKLNQLHDFIYLAGNGDLREKLADELNLYIRNIVPLRFTLDSHFEGVDTDALPFEFIAMTICES